MPAIFILGFSASASEVREEGGVVKVSTEFFAIHYSLTRGSYSVFDHSGQVVVRDAAARAVLVPAAVGRPERVISSERAAKRDWSRREVRDQLGNAEEIEVKCTRRDGPSLATIFRVYPSRRFFTVRVILGDIASALRRWRVKSLEPMHVRGPGGGLFLGDDPANDKILENGSNLYLDVMVNMFSAGDRPPAPSWLGSGKSVSDFSSIIFDAPTGHSALAGFLSGEEVGLVRAGFERARSGRDGSRRGFSDYGASWSYRPPLAADRAFESAPLYLDFFAESPFTALEDYGRALGQWLGVRPWPGDVPAGWNSWGEYYHEINEEIILKNLDFAVARFLPFGMKYFQIDDGYSPFWGDWDADPAKFPHGMKWMADRIRDQGMIPGLWIAPFCADVRSATFKEHPEWFLPRRGAIPRLMIEKDMRVLDLTRPEAQEHLRRVVRKYVHEWGYQWIKVDFAYYVLYYSRLPGPERTVPEVYREGMRIIKEEAGPDTFVLGIGLTGFNYGLVDGQRITLDNMPAWSNGRGMFSWRKLTFAQGLVPTARTVARRYWLNYGVWVNHPDLIFFNNDRWPEWGSAPLTFDESLCFASLTGLTGGIVKLGDKLRDMTDQEVDVVDRLLPVYQATARPLDLFEKETPEVWDLKVKTDFESWDVVGLFNWGENWAGREHIPESARTIGADLATLGLDPSAQYLVFDFWNEKFLGVFSGSIGLELAPRTARVLAVRRLPGHPWFLSYNRHLSQGGVEIRSIKWDEEKGALAGEQDAVPGFNYHLYFFAPGNYTVASARVDGAGAGVEQEGEVVKLSFTAGGKRVKWEIFF
ncbi:MAG TPA: alpha-galactosidase [bacterium]|nr:alpha-galactosidase [bacterium]